LSLGKKIVRHHTLQNEKWKSSLGYEEKTYRDRKERVVR
jgi:hypothetical protein